MNLTEGDKEFIKERISNLKKYIESSEEQIQYYKIEISVLEKVLN